MLTWLIPVAFTLRPSDTTPDCCEHLSTVIAAPSLPAATHYLEQSGVVRRWNTHLHQSAHGYAFYFTVLTRGGRHANQIKVCETKRGRVIGATNLSAGEPDCER